LDAALDAEEVLSARALVLAKPKSNALENANACFKWSCMGNCLSGLIGIEHEISGSGER
jgi:hypothetical protein